MAVKKFIKDLPAVIGVIIIVSIAGAALLFLMLLIGEWTFWAFDQSIVLRP